MLAGKLKMNVVKCDLRKVTTVCSRQVVGAEGPTMYDTCGHNLHKNSQNSPRHDKRKT